MADFTSAGNAATISEICGENICVKSNGQVAEWHHGYSGGSVFSATPMDRNQVYRIRLFDGSSHIGVGFTQKDPYTFQNIRIASSQHNFNEVGNIRLHRAELIVNVSLEPDKFVCKTNETLRGTIKPGPVWIYVNIKFGKARICLETKNSKKLHFHDICGENIVLEDKKYLARLSNGYPSAVCILEKRLSVGDKIKFELKPITSGSGSETPHYYHVAFGVSSLSPQDLRATAPEIFSVSNIVTSLRSQESKSHLGRMECFEKSGRSKDECDGFLTVTRKSETILQYKHTRQSGADQEKTIKYPVYVFFELFRASVAITEDNSSCGYAVMSAADGADVNSSKPEMGKSKEPGENTWESPSGWKSSGDFMQD
ncbi:uncharacterized protein LOC117316014 [Pecten maximus]|uniref:uncharacterized protein LOC117316014 n=1 Tax=Pecten maximus TaxID=6579 RepID=UPI001458DE87|nr:uncharacterized protein LOC117316014 [Pecten maximus]